MISLKAVSNGSHSLLNRREEGVRKAPLSRLKSDNTTIDKIEKQTIKSIEPIGKQTDQATMVTYEYPSLDNIDEVDDGAVKQCKMAIASKKKQVFESKINFLLWKQLKI